jgi:hypothetical protein
MTDKEIEAIWQRVTGFSADDERADIAGFARALLSASIADTAGANAECAPREAQPVACPHCWEVDCLTCGTDAAPTPERADADTAGAKPVAWRWRLTAEINGKQWGPGPWEYTIYPEKFENRRALESRVLAERKEPVIDKSMVKRLMVQHGLTHPTPDDASQWISVDDRLPEEEKDVLVTGPAWNKEDYSEGRYFSIGFREEGVWKDDKLENLHPPSHWMPIASTAAIDQARQSGEEGK